MSQTKTLSFEDDHHRGIGYVDAYLDDGGGDENLCLTTDETLHLFFLVLGLHATMHLAKTELGEGLF